MMFGEKTVGEKLLQYRKKKGLTLREVAAKTGISGQHLSLIEKGHIQNVQPKTEKKIMDLIDSEEE